MAQKYYGDYSKEILGRQGMFDPAQIESGSVKLDPNYGLYEAKKGYAQAEKSGNEADKAYYRDMGKSFREQGATLDPNNTMNAQQFSDAYWGQDFGGSTSGSGGSGGYTTQTAYKGPSMGSGGDYFTNYMNDMNSYMDQYGQAGQELLRNYQMQYSQALQGLQNLLAQKPEVPESVKYAIDSLKKQTDQNIQYINEDMNRRGIYNSTIATDRAAQERTRMSDQERALLSNWLDQQHQQMYQTALKMADMQAGYASNYANLAAQTTLGALDKRMGLAGKAFDIQNQMAQQQRQEELARQQAEADAAQRAADRENANYWKMMEYTTPTAGERLSYDAAIRRLSTANALTPQEAAVSAAWSNIMSGQATEQDWRIVGRTPPGMGGDLGSEYRSLLNLRGDPVKWNTLPPEDKQYVESRLVELRGAGASSNGGNPLVISGQDPWPQWIQEGKAAGKTDEEMRQIMRQNGVDPEKYLPLPKTSRAIPYGGYPMTSGAPSPTSAYPVGGGRTSYNP